MPKKEVFDFKPAPRPDQVDDKGPKQMEDRKHRRGGCADSASSRESVRMRFLGTTPLTLNPLDYCRERAPSRAWLDECRSEILRGLLGAKAAVLVRRIYPNGSSVRSVARVPERGGSAGASRGPRRLRLSLLTSDHNASRTFR